MTLTGTLTDHGVNPLTGATIIVTPTPAVTVDKDGQVVHLGGTEVTTDETGFFTVDLATGPGLSYTVRTTAGGRLRPVRFAAEADGATVDLSDAHPIPAPSPMAEYVRGASAYEVWISEGNEGTVDDFLAAQRGPSPYELAVADGFDGTQAEWLASLTGADGADGLMSLTPTETPGVLKIGAPQ